MGPNPLTSPLPETVPSVPIWGGVECTLNRVADRYFDQGELSGHAHRTGDFDAVAALGIRTLRCGFLWERFARLQSWQCMDACMASLRRLSIQPIAGLMHHGSGPSHTSLLDPEFPEQLAMYAASMAERYPDIAAYTPVNEPNTTARFSGRYGIWYPHHRSLRGYLLALLHQAKATVLSMQAIRKVRPDARLVQTDDCGGVCGTAEMRSMAELLHERQWLTFDLLCGRVNRTHPLFAYITSAGIPEDTVLWFLDNPCPPDVIGLNYYVTSDRFLDHRTWLYPETLMSGEGPYIDVEAVRVDGCGTATFSRPISEAWARYSLPIALTEVHLGGSHHEQIHWLSAAYMAMKQAKQQGITCEGMTVWALLGSYFWNELVTRDNGHYEPGVFDVRSGVPVPTPIAGLVEQMAKGFPLSHAALDGSGWWQRPDRICYPWADPAETRAA